MKLFANTLNIVFQLFALKVIEYYVILKYIHVHFYEWWELAIIS